MTSENDRVRSESPESEVTGAAMRRMQFERIEDDYYLGGAIGEDIVDSDDELSSDDEVKSHLKRLAGIDDKKAVAKDAFGRTRRRSEFEDDMDDELDRSITEYANEHMGVSSAAIEGPKEEEVDEDEMETRKELKKIDDKKRDEDREIEMKMASLELLPYEVDLTDSEVDPEMPAAVLKNNNGEPIKLVYSCQRGVDFDIEDRRRRQRERRRRVAVSRPSEEERRREVIKSIVKSYVDLPNEQKQSREAVALKGKKQFVEGGSCKTDGTPLSSILKKTKVVEAKTEVEDVKEEKMEVDEAADVEMKEEVEEETKVDEAEKEENPIKKAARQRQKEIEKNDELFYDDEEDEDNEKWVQEKRAEKKGRRKSSETGDETAKKSKKGVSKEKEARPRLDDGSDAVLSCPGCMAELTSDCQRHEVYMEQYRAMFVSNCRLESEKMKVEKTGKEKRKERQRARKSGQDLKVDDDGVFTPVKCAVCNTLVAMMDEDEIYHFFNVLAGYA